MKKVVEVFIQFKNSYAIIIAIDMLAVNHGPGLYFELAFVVNTVFCKLKFLTYRR